MTRGAFLLGPLPRLANDHMGSDFSKTLGVGNTKPIQFVRGQSGTRARRGPDQRGRAAPFAESWHNLWQKRAGEFLNRLRPHGHLTSVMSPNTAGRYYARNIRNQEGKGRFRHSSV